MSATGASGVVPPWYTRKNALMSSPWRKPRLTSLSMMAKFTGPVGVLPNVEMRMAVRLPSSPSASMRLPRMVTPNGPLPR